MIWDMKCEKYIYLQVSEKVMLDIFAGKYYPGDKIPSVRQQNYNYTRSW